MILERIFGGMGRDALRKAELALERPLAEGEAACAKINGRGLRLGLDGWHADLAYVTAEVRAGEAGRPVDLGALAAGALGKDRITVQAASVEVGQRQANAIAKAMLGQLALPVAVERAVVAFDPGDRVVVAARARVKGHAVPVKARVRVAPAGPAKVAVTPERVTLFGLPITWAVRPFEVDVPRLPGVEAPLTGLAIDGRKARIQVGGAPADPIPAARRQGAAHWVELVARGEVEAGEARVADARAVLIDRTPGDPLQPANWAAEGTLRLGYGRVEVPEATLRARMAAMAAQAGFQAEHLAITAEGVAIAGKADVLGIPVPVACTLACEATKRGELRLVPRDVKVAGLGLGRAQLLDQLAKAPGMRREGDGVVVDLQALAGVDLPALRRVATADGKLVLAT